MIKRPQVLTERTIGLFRSSAAFCLGAKSLDREGLSQTAGMRQPGSLSDKNRPSDKNPGFAGLRPRPGTVFD
jgi:hypothetical protein